MSSACSDREQSCQKSAYGNVIGTSYIPDRVILFDRGCEWDNVFVLFLEISEKSESNGVQKIRKTKFHI